MRPESKSKSFKSVQRLGGCGIELTLFLSMLCCPLQAGGVQHCSVCADGAFGAGDGAGKEEAADAGDQTAKL